MILLDDWIIRSILNNQNKKMVLATIINTNGPTPREIGTNMLILENAQTIGTIGGGFTENFIFQRAVALITGKSEVQAEIQHIAVKPEADNIGLSNCGGNIDVLLELIQDQHFWRFALDLQLNEKEAVMITSLFPPYSKMILDSGGSILQGSLLTKNMLPVSELQNICFQRKIRVLQISDEQSWLVEPILKKERLLIFRSWPCGQRSS